VTHLAEFFNHLPFCRIGFFTVTLGIFDHPQQAFYPAAQDGMTIEALDQGFVAVKGEHGRSPQGVSADRAVLVTTNVPRRGDVD
jgi:hypothetical protein